MITFRLGDSLPNKVYKKLQREASTAGELRRLSERYLDDGRGACHLKIPDAAAIIRQTLRFYDQDIYRLQDWIVMPNHVHVVYRKPRAKIGKIVGQWKSYTSRQIGDVIGQRGSLWQRDYFDRYARDPQHLFNMSSYVILNPVKAGLVDDPFDWPYSSVHDYHPDFKDDLRKWYRAWKDRFWDVVA